MAAAGIEASARGTDPRMPRRPGSIESVPPSSRPARSLARGDRGAPLSAPRRPSRNRDELPLLRGPARRQETSNPLQPCELRPASPAGGRAGPRRRADPGCPNRSAAPTAGAPGTVTPPPRLGLASRAEHPPNVTSRASRGRGPLQEVACAAGTRKQASSRLGGVTLRARPRGPSRARSNRRPRPDSVRTDR
jgi:hypothetical protein